TVPGHATGEHNAGGAALHVPLPGAARGRVKIVDVDHDVRTRRGEKAEVLEVSIAAKLDLDASVPLRAQAGSHDLHCAAKKGERRFPHAFKLDRQQLGHMVLAGRAQNIQGIEAPFGDILKSGPPQLIALSQAEFTGLFTGNHRAFLSTPCSTAALGWWR